MSINQFDMNTPSATFDYFDFVVPQDGTYKAEVAGAQGGTGSREGVGGLGAIMRGSVPLEAGTTLRILVGQKGNTRGNTEGPSGGGASYIAKVEYPNDKRNNPRIVYCIRSGNPATEDDATIAILQEFVGELGEVVSINEADIASYDFTGTSLVVVGAPALTFTDVANLSTLKSLDVATISMCRSTSRNFGNIGSASGSDSTNSLGVNGYVYNSQSLLGMSNLDSISLTSSHPFHGIGNILPEATSHFEGRRSAVASVIKESNYLIHFGFNELSKADLIIKDIFRGCILKALKGVPELTPLIVAGGGGGYAVGITLVNQQLAHGKIEPDGNPGMGGNGFGLGGIGGNGGEFDGTTRASGGGGWFTPGTGPVHGKALKDGGHSIKSSTYAWGGHGSGGGLDDSTSFGACGGGGGYSGGGGGYAGSANGEAAGGGGGSLNVGADQHNESGVNEGDGWVILKLLGSIKGTVFGVDGPAAKKVLAYNRTTGELSSQTISSVDSGEFELAVPPGGEYFCVVLDEDKNALVYDKLVPEVS